MWEAGQLVTVSPRWGNSFPLMAVSLVDEEPGFKVDRDVPDVDINPGEWAMLVKKFVTQTDPDNDYTRCNHYILMFEERLWLYNLGATCQSHLVDKETWDNPGWD